MMLLGLIVTISMYLVMDYIDYKERRMKEA